MTDPYQTPAAVESAIRSAAQKAARNDKSLSVQERIRLEYFHRFLCRIFSETPTDAWFLKGGAALLARVASARATSDVDLFNRSHSLAAALTELRRLAALDLGDFFRFEYVSHTDSLGGKQQAYTKSIRVSFDVYLGVNKKDRLNVDLVVKAVTTETPKTFTAPPDWDASYRRLASPIPDCKDHLTVALATNLVNELLEPVLAGKAKGLRWDPGIRAWV